MPIDYKGSIPYILTRSEIAMECGYYQKPILSAGKWSGDMSSSKESALETVLKRLLQRPRMMVMLLDMHEGLARFCDQMTKKASQGKLDVGCAMQLRQYKRVMPNALAWMSAIATSCASVLKNLSVLSVSHFDSASAGFAKFFALAAK